MYQPKTYTVESVTSGHPDKMCDQISDAILDTCLKQDPKTRAGIECFGANDLFVIGGEITTTAKVDYGQVARDVFDQIGYKEKLKIQPYVNTQSPDIAMGVDTGGAGDQGIMYGYATDETPEFLPNGVVLVHKLAHELENLRRGELSWIRPDGKTQVTVVNGKVEKVLVSTQHSEDISQEEIRTALIEKLIHPHVGNLKDEDIFVNPTGRFVVGGFVGDAGLTGRKIMVDTYGGLAPHGGGAFSGKDSTKVDRSAAYMARFVAKNLVARGLAKKCLVSVAYAIGRSEPMMVEAIDENEKRIEAVNEFDFRPKAIIERLGLTDPIFQQTAAYGHFGKEGLPWEKIES